MNKRIESGSLLAAVDMGSNSFRLEIGMVVDGHIQRVDYIKEPVRQGLGFDEERNLTPEAMARGLQCLTRFAERLRGFEPWQVRAVATQTLREAKNKDVFLQAAHSTLGFPIEVISGLEEARLIYQGVSRLLPDTAEGRLVIDIGGRSTEIMLGVRSTSLAAESYRLGSVSWSGRYFANGEYSQRTFEHAEVAAQSVLDTALQLFKPGSWQMAYGSSGSVGAVSDVLAESGWEKTVISRDGLAWLKSQMIRSGDLDKLRLAGLKDDRRAVFAGGVAVLNATMSLLGIEQLHVAQGALRHGVLFDMLARDEQRDVRSDAVHGLARRFATDDAQGRRVAGTALALLAQLQLPADLHARVARKLEWAATLHEIGNLVSPTDSHRHAAYIIDHAEVPGFTVDELHRLSLLVLGQRGKLKKLDADFADTVFVNALMCLRLSVVLCHARRDPLLQGLALLAKTDGFELRTSPDWATQFPQSMHLLGTEVQAWDKTDVKLALVTA